MKIGTARVRTYIHRNICPLLAFISKYIHRYMKTNSEDSLCVKALIKTKQKKKKKEKKKTRKNKKSHRAEKKEKKIWGQIRQRTRNEECHSLNED